MAQISCRHYLSGVNADTASFYRLFGSGGNAWPGPILGCLRSSRRNHGLACWKLLFYVVSKTLFSKEEKDRKKKKKKNKNKNKNKKEKKRRKAAPNESCAFEWSRSQRDSQVNK